MRLHTISKAKRFLNAFIEILVRTVNIKFTYNQLCRNFYYNVRKYVFI